MELGTDDEGVRGVPRDHKTTEYTSALSRPELIN